MLHGGFGSQVVVRQFKSRKPMMLLALEKVCVLTNWRLAILKTQWNWQGGESSS